MPLRRSADPGRLQRRRPPHGRRHRGRRAPAAPAALVSASGADVAGPQPTRIPGAGYNAVSNVDIYFAMGARPARHARAPAAAAAGPPVDWAAVTAHLRAGQEPEARRRHRPLARLASPTTPSTRCSPTARASTAARLHRRDRSATASPAPAAAPGLSTTPAATSSTRASSCSIYGKALQELDAAKTRIAEGNLDNDTGAPHAVDEAWAAVAGAAGRQRRLAATRSSGDRAQPRDQLQPQGKVRNPLEAAFTNALDGSSQRATLPPSTAPHAEIKGYLNAIFYLGALRYAKAGRDDQTPRPRARLHSLRAGPSGRRSAPLVAQASPSAAQTVEDAFDSARRRSLPGQPDDRRLRRPERARGPRRPRHPRRRCRSNDRRPQ